MEKRFEVSRNWQFLIHWKKDWKFIGFVQWWGFGKYIGITFKRKEWG